MLKSFTILLAAVAATSPALAETFTYQGKTYAYTIEQRGHVRILTGADVTSDVPFVLNVSRNWVEGTVDGQPVSFSTHSVKPLTRNVTVTEVAAK